MQSSPSFYEESNVHYQFFIPFKKRNIPGEPSFILREQSRVKGQGTWLVRAPHPALGFMWKACPLGNEDTSLNPTQPVGLFSPQPPPNPFSLHPSQTLSHHGPPYTSESTPLCKDNEGKSQMDLGCDMMDGFDRFLWRLRQRERKICNPSMVQTLDKDFCVEKNNCVQGKRSKEGFRSSLKEAY